jgi:hypothetical protein
MKGRRQILRRTVMIKGSVDTLAIAILSTFERKKG